MNTYGYKSKFPGDEFNRMMRCMTAVSRMTTGADIAKFANPTSALDSFKSSLVLDMSSQLQKAFAGSGVANPAFQMAIRANDLTSITESLRKVTAPHLVTTGDAIRSALGTSRIDLSGVKIAAFDPSVTAKLVRGVTPAYGYENAVAKLREVMRTATERVAALMPPEWAELDNDETDAAIALAVDQGIATVWAPNVEVIQALLDAPESDRLGTLLEHQNAVLNDIQRVLDDIGAPELGDSPALAQKALDAFRDHPETSQAMSANLLTTVIHHNFGAGKIGAALKLFKKRHPDQVPLQSFRLVVILRAVATGLTWTDDGDVEGFHRNAAVHHASLQQYSPENALAGLMLVTNLMREAHEIYGRRALEVTDELDEAEQLGEAA